MNSTTFTVLGIALCLTTACQSTAPPTARFMAGGGYSEVDIDVSGLGSDEIEGYHATLRGEIAQAPDFAPNVEFGARLLTGLHDFEDTEDGITLELETFDLGAVAVVRPFLDINESFRLYVEAFGGYRHYWGESEARGFGISIDDDDDDGGGIFGAGIGSEYKIDDSTRFLFGLEWSRHYSSTSDVDFDTDDYAALIGIAVVF
ncbi:MAG: outer membrane beta-barrel protein [Planctomycetota bacterium]|jgi:hypothetical protein